jgi:hypothetical protein
MYVEFDEVDLNIFQDIYCVSRALVGEPVVSLAAG